MRGKQVCSSSGKPSSGDTWHVDFGSLFGSAPLQLPATQNMRQKAGHSPGHEELVPDDSVDQSCLP